MRAATLMLLFGPLGCRPAGETTPPEGDPEPAVATVQGPSPEPSAAVGDPVAEPGPPPEGATETRLQWGPVTEVGAEGGHELVKSVLDKDDIRRVVRGGLAEIRRCYEQGLARDPALRGKVTIRFTIDPEGKVSEATVVADELPDPTVGTCIANTARTWQFPPPRGGGSAMVTYPFVLEPAQESDEADETAPRV